MARGEAAVELSGSGVLPGKVVRGGFTDRRGGVSLAPFASLNLGLHVGDDPRAVVENRERVVAALGGDPVLGLDDCVFPRQVHGDKVHVVTAADRGRGARDWDETAIEADALITNQPGIAIAVLVADCVPIILFDPVARAVGVVHAGWKGTVAGIASKAAGQMQVEFGSRPENMRALFGPAIGPDAFEVGEEVASYFRDCFGPAAASEEILLSGKVDADGYGSGLPPGRYGGLNPLEDGGEAEAGPVFHANLWRANAYELVEGAGLMPRHVDSASCAVDTFNSYRYFSHRRNPKTGRFAAIAALR